MRERRANSICLVVNHDALPLIFKSRHGLQTYCKPGIRRIIRLRHFNQNLIVHLLRPVVYPGGLPCLRQRIRRAAMISSGSIKGFSRLLPCAEMDHMQIALMHVGRQNTFKLCAWHI